MHRNEIFIDPLKKIAELCTIFDFQSEISGKSNSFAFKLMGNTERRSSD